MSLDLPEWARRALRCPATGAPLESAEGSHGQELVARTQGAPRLADPLRAPRLRGARDPRVRPAGSASGSERIASEPDSPPGRSRPDVTL